MIIKPLVIVAFVLLLTTSPMARRIDPASLRNRDVNADAMARTYEAFRGRYGFQVRKPRELVVVQNKLVTTADLSK